MNEIEFTEEKIKNRQENLSLIEEQISKFPLDTDVPLNLIKNQRRLKAELEGLKQNCDRLKQRREIPPLLPYLPNRSDHKYDLEEAFKISFQKQPPKPIFCIIHGDQFQCHYKFLERLTKLSLPEIFKQNASINLIDYHKNSIGTYELTWPSEMRNLKELQKRLTRKLAGLFPEYGLSSKEKINDYLANIGPVIIRIHLLTEYWQQHKSGIIEGFLKFWQDWPQLRDNQCLIICLFIKYQIKKNLGFFKNLKFQSLNKKILKSIKDLDNSGFSEFDRLIGVVLPELQGIRQGDVESWARNEAIKSCWSEENVQDLISAIQYEFERWEKEHKCDAIPMEELAKRLTNILNGKMIVKEEVA